jgi:hypothetical protein
MASKDWGGNAFYNWIITNAHMETVGLYLENPRGIVSSTRGTLTINPGRVGEESDVMFVLFGLIAILERTRRDIKRTWQSTQVAGR